MSYTNLYQIRSRQPRDLKPGGVIVHIELDKSGIFKSQQHEIDAMMTSSLCFPASVSKTCQRQPTELKLGKMIVHLKFHKVYVLNFFFGGGGVGRVGGLRMCHPPYYPL